MKNINYEELKCQGYFTSKLFTNREVELLCRLRSRNIDVKSNFKTKFTQSNNAENLKCVLKNCAEMETQKHLTLCKPILDIFNEKYDKSGIEYEDIFSKSLIKQRNVTKLFKILLEIRTSLIDKMKNNEMIYLTN